MTAALTRTAIVQLAVERGIADYIINNLVVTVPDDQIDDTRVTIKQWAKKASPHIAACVEEDLQRAVNQQKSDIGDRLQMIIDALGWGFVPKGRP
jgi:hypothetical protein